MSLSIIGPVYNINWRYSVAFYLGSSFTDRGFLANSSDVSLFRASKAADTVFVPHPDK